VTSRKTEQESIPCSVANSWSWYRNSSYCRAHRRKG